MKGKQKLSRKSNLRMMNVIHTKWWNEWCDYTSFNVSRNSDEHATEERARRSGSVQTAYNPGKLSSSIDQSCLLKEIQKMKREASAQKTQQNTSASLEVPLDAKNQGKPKDVFSVDQSVLENRPGRITNIAIIDNRFYDELVLKEDLIEHHDFEVLLP